MKSQFSRLRQVSPEVFYSNGGFLAAGGDLLAVLKDLAGRSRRRRCRLCFHAAPDDDQQEMLIVMHRSSYIRPHRHFGKVETLGIVEGNADALLFDDAGLVTTVVAMSPACGGGNFFYRMPQGLFHTLVFKSEWLVFVETTIGPFDPAKTEGATWAPPETDAAAGHAFLSGLAIPAR